MGDLILGTEIWMCEFYRKWNIVFVDQTTELITTEGSTEAPTTEATTTEAPTTVVETTVGVSTAAPSTEVTTGLSFCACMLIET